MTIVLSGNPAAYATEILSGSVITSNGSAIVSIGAPLAVELDIAVGPFAAGTSSITFSLIPLETYTLGQMTQYTGAKITSGSSVSSIIVNALNSACGDTMMIAWQVTGPSASISNVYARFIARN